MKSMATAPTIDTLPRIKTVCLRRFDLDAIAPISWAELTEKICGVNIKESQVDQIGIRIGKYQETLIFKEYYARFHPAFGRKVP